MRTANVAVSNRGRRPGICPEKTTALVGAIKDGAFIETAVVVAGMPKTTFYRWLRQASEDEQAGRKKSAYIGFAIEIWKALAIAELTLIRKVQSGGPYWQRYACLLERRFPEDGADTAAQQVRVIGRRESHAFTIIFSLESTS